ncbi:helix-turn-helix domain-containing protein [Pseudothioclava nitratireducens]|uniref:helix-turn-helix domain-containing protein n=1 Tax=Pseudothioclava nitratireducens TaxID=1928646 RepID=UPI0023DB1776|nr:helix-turn-helix domain-containing protein [Defluviimonas nitratireducens]MDF1621637.1 helix-turn-helix domain-containing protein [Defluviimonas nitratireducens]
MSSPVNILLLPLPSYDELLDQYPGFFDCFVDANEAAQILGSTPGSLAQHRNNGTGPDYYKDGASVRYQRRDLIDYMRSKRVKIVSAA